MLDIRMIDVPAIHTAVIRGRMPASALSKFVPASCGEVWSFARDTGMPKPGRHVALYLADGVVEAGAEVNAPFAGNDRVLNSQLPSGRVATTTHLGPYGRLGDAHSAIKAWAAEHRYRLSGICWEIYGHWEDRWNADPSQIRTDVFHLLRTE